MSEAAVPGLAGPTPVLSIVIPTYDRFEHLAGALDSIERQTLPEAAYEVIVVDNGADAGAREEFLAASGSRRMIYIVEPRAGVSRARNIGVAQARADIVAFIDDDARADPDWARAIVARFVQQPRAAALGGPIELLWPSGRPAWVHAGMLGLLSGVDHGPRARALAPHEWIAGANIAFRRAPLLAAGGFDEALGRVGRMLLSNEEMALVDALRQAGHLAFYEPAARVRHHVHAERVSQRWLRERIAWQVVSDFVGAPDTPFPDRVPDIQMIRSFLQRLPPSDRAIHGLFATLSEPDTAQHQLAAVVALMRLLLRNAGDWRTVVDLDAAP